jgi:predicted DNA binding CopG/RHH family protein
MKKKNKRTHVTMTIKEYELIKRKAEYIGLTVSAYIRMKCLDKLVETKED